MNKLKVFIICFFCMTRAWTQESEPDSKKWMRPPFYISLDAGFAGPQLGNLGKYPGGLIEGGFSMYIPYRHKDWGFHMGFLGNGNFEKLFGALTYEFELKQGLPVMYEFGIGQGSLPSGNISSTPDRPFLLWQKLSFLFDFHNAYINNNISFPRYAIGLYHLWLPQVIIANQAADGPAFGLTFSYIFEFH